MEHFVGGIVALAQAHRLLAYSLAFLLASGESLPVLGALIPGTATIVAFGALVPSGAVQFVPLALATMAGAIAGDGFSYWLGHRYRADVAKIWPLRRHPGLVDRGEAFFAHHGGTAIITARFTPGVRAVVPLAAGVAGMPVIRFYVMNVLSAILWAPLHVLMGVLIGASLTVLGAIAGRLVVLVFAAFLLLTLVVWLTPRAIRWVGRMATRVQGPIHSWAASQDTWLHRQVLSLLDPSQPEIQGLLTLGALLIAGLWLFLGVLQDVIAGDPLVRANTAVFQLLQSLRVEAVDRIAVTITELGDATVVIAVTLSALLWLAWRHAWRAMFYVVSAVVGAAAFALLLKVTLRQVRPTPAYAGWNAFSFPSSHTTVSVALYGFLAILIAREVATRWRVATVLAAVLLVCLIGCSRLYLGVHWLSDIVAGFAFGLAWVALLGIAYLRHAPHRIRAGGLALVVGTTLIASGTVYVALTHNEAVQRYAVRLPVRTMTLAAWEQGGWADLPARRFDLFGEYENPFTVQWAGSLESLKADLIRHTWTPPAPWTVRSSLEWLSPQASPGSLTVLPQLNGGRPEDLVMVRTSGLRSAGQRLVLRLWRSDVLLSDGARLLPLWIGTVVAERVQHVAWLVTIMKDEENMVAPLRLLHSDLLSTQFKRRSRLATDPRSHGLVLLGKF